MAACIALACTVLACGEEGFTPDCPDVPRYELSRDSDTGRAYRHRPGDPDTPLTDAEEQQVSDAINAGCITGPGEARSIDIDDL